VILHDHPRSSNAQKVRFLLAVLGLEYERRTVPLADERPGWHLAVNPVGGIPALLDGDVVLAESNAILRFLAARERRRDLLPHDPRERAPVDWLLDTVGTALRPICREVDGPAYGWRPHLGIGSAPARPQDVPGAIAQIAPQLEVYSRLIGSGGYACHGRLTVADCAAMPSLWRLLHAGALAGHAKLRTWAETVAAHPAWATVAAESGVPA
jgi:glutathione S-transferase